MASLPPGTHLGARLPLPTSQKGPQGTRSGFRSPPLGPSWAAHRVFGSLPGPSNNRSKRKMKMLKFAQFFPQKLSLGELLLIQDPPKRPPLDLIDSPKGLLGPRRGAKNTSWGLAWTLRKSTSKKTQFLHSFPEHREMPIFPRFPAHGGNRTLPKMTIFALWSVPGAPPERVPFSQDRAWTPPKLTFHLLEVPGLLSRRPRGL